MVGALTLAIGRGRVRTRVRDGSAALAGQCDTAPPASLEPVGQQDQQRVVAQVIVVDEVFVAQSDGGDALRHQRPQRVYPERGIAVILKRAATGRRAR